jgi:hypothetical protein
MAGRVMRSYCAEPPYGANHSKGRCAMPSPGLGAAAGILMRVSVSCLRQAIH